MVAFKQIPSNVRVPGFYAELDASKANTASANQRALIIGQITSAGLATPNVPLISSGVADAKTQGGQGSMLAAMTAAYKLNDPFGEVWYLPLADNAGGAQATATIAFSGTPTAAGVVSLYVGGNLACYGAAGAISVPITASETSTAIATAVAAAINAMPDLPVTAAAATGTVTITARHKGLAGNDIDIRLNYLGSAGGEVTPPGLTATITAMTGGTLNPSLTTALANLADKAFDFIVTPYTDATSIAAISALLNDTAGRWNWQSQIYGHAFMAYRGAFSSLTTFGLTMNDQHTSCMGFNDSPSPVWAWAAAVAGAAAVSVRADPGLPIGGLAGLAIQGVLAPPVASRFSAGLRNTLLFDGIATFKVASDGTVLIEDLITTYQLNTAGQADNSYLQSETLFLLMYLLRGMRTFVTSNYGRTKLAADGTRAGPGAGVVTPSIIRADLIGWYRQQEIAGEVQQSDAFAAGLIVQLNPTNPSRVDVLFDPVLIQDLRVFATLVQFRLQ